jgi:hypothetical protein
LDDSSLEGFVIIVVSAKIRRRCSRATLKIRKLIIKIKVSVKKQTKILNNKNAFSPAEQRLLTPDSSLPKRTNKRVQRQQAANQIPEMARKTRRLVIISTYFRGFTI